MAAGDTFCMARFRGVRSYAEIDLHLLSLMKRRSEGKGAPGFRGLIEAELAGHNDTFDLDNIELIIREQYRDE